MDCQLAGGKANMQILFLSADTLSAQFYMFTNCVITHLLDKILKKVFTSYISDGCNRFDIVCVSVCVSLVLFGE